MIKREEVSNPNSCLNRAKDDEYVFVLLARDEAAAETIRFWAARRLLLNKNSLEDPQIDEALRAANFMESELARGRKY